MKTDRALSEIKHLARSRREIRLEEPDSGKTTPGTVRAPDPDIVVTLRPKLATSVLMATLVVGPIGASMAAHAHATCVIAMPYCGEAATAASCCLGHRGDRSSPAILEGRTPSTPDLSTARAVPPVLCIAPRALPVSAVNIVQLRGSPPDFPTFYGTLLI
jgi:hypothetical protein